MELELSMFLIMCPLAFLAGLIDSIAGGGGLISLPAYLVAGVPIHFALGTNKLSSILGAAIASFRYYKNKFVDIFLCLPCIPVALIGSAIGTNLTLLVNEKYLRYILLVVLPVTAFYVLKKKKFDETSESIPRKKVLLPAMAVSLVVGMYDGFFGPGTGTFLILLYSGFAKMNSRNALGNSKIVNLSSNLSSAVVFFYNGRVILPLGLCAGLFSILGGYIGSGLVINRGTKLVRYVILVVLILLFFKIAYDIMTGNL